MKNREFAHLVQSGVRPVVTFTKSIEDCEGYAEANMRARVTGARFKHDDMLVFAMDFSEFDDFNRPLESANYYDKEGAAVLTAREAGYYKPVDDYFLMPDVEAPFAVVEAEQLQLYDRYRASGASESYVCWLEQMVLAKQEGAKEA